MSRITLKTAFVSILFLGTVLLAGNVHDVTGAGETYSLTSVPGRGQEGDPGGISITLAVNNAGFPATYVFVWTVTDPSGSSRSTLRNVVSNQASWSLTTIYPANYSGASINLVGVYNVNVTQTSPSIRPGAGLGQFQIGLTDNPSYQRTFQVLIKASGYLPTDNVTISIALGASSVTGFPTYRTADASGRISLSWLTSPGTALGSYMVTLLGTKTPPKNPADAQQFTIYPTNVTTSPLWSSRSSIQRSQVLEFRFNATYLSGLAVTSGSGAVRITEPDGVTSHLVTASYDSSMKTFRAFYNIPLSSQVGTWSGSLDAKSFDDGNGNGGPMGALTVGFNVQPASLTVSLSASGTAYVSGNVIPILAAVVTPGGANFTQGTVMTAITVSGQRVGTPFSLVYDQSRGKWSGSYTVNAADPSGTWLITVTANDTYGNTGQSTASYSVITANSPQSQPFSLTSWVLWLFVLGTVGLGFGILILRRRGVTHREVKLDVQAIKHQADQVKSDDFLQSIQAQLKRRTERLAQEKPKSD